MRISVDTLKKDIPASIVVFLVALPLCLGVALASGANFLSGIIAGIVGGIVVGALSGSQTSVSGPAAGLTAVVLSSIQQLGAFEIFLTSVVIAGVLQLILGIARGGIISNFIPSNVIKGLLAAIGIILILKQIPHAVGYDAVPEDDFSFDEPGGGNTFTVLLGMLDYITPGALIISLVSMVTLVYWDKTPLKRFSFFPASLFVVVLGVLLNSLFSSVAPALAIGSSHLVNLPPIDTSNLANYFHLPDAAHFSNWKVYTVALTIAAVASLETLLNLEAVDRLDPHKRESPPNRELLAQGVGNITSGLLGGIPVTSVIVRSSVNIGSGNATKMSTILHGIFMLVSVIALSNVLNLIPLASLAAILIVTGYKLANIALFKQMFKKGWNQFIPFVVTILAIVFTDLLIGVLIGLAISIFYILRINFNNSFKMRKEKLAIGEIVKLELSEEVSFLNKASIKTSLWKIPDNTKVMIDATHSEFIDDDVLEIIDDFKNTVAPERNIALNIIGLKRNYQFQDHIHFLNVLDKETQLRLKPNEILDILKEGNLRFAAGRSQKKYYLQQIDATGSEQNPMAVIISCIDSRTSPEMIFDASIGELLTIRIAGNITTDSIIGSAELAIKEIGAKVIIVMGHSNCGAVSAAIRGLKDGKIGHITSRIDTAIRMYDSQTVQRDGEKLKMLSEITWLNVRNSIHEMLERSHYLSEMASKNEIAIVGAYYHTSTGKVEFEEEHFGNTEVEKELGQTAGSEA
jgi:carbonic anhydrase